MAEISSSNKYVRAILVAVIAVVVSFVLRNYLFHDNNTIDKKLQTASQEANKMCPVIVDSITRLDSTIALPGKIFQYNYTVKIDTTKTPVNALKMNLEKSILTAVKTNPSTKEFRDNDVTMDYRYNDDKGDFLFKIEITPAKYKQ
jgi:hypothetical protein